jgi:uncharacterized MAPEG superfamily protein
LTLKVAIAIASSSSPSLVTVEVSSTSNSSSRSLGRPKAHAMPAGPQAPRFSEVLRIRCGFVTIAVMNIELAVLAWGCILALVHVFAAVRVKTRQYGTAWNVGARDDALPPPAPIVGRLARAQANFFETFPLYAAAALIVSAAHLTSRWTAIGALMWLVGRIVYLPLYAAGVPYVRSAAWGISLIGILLVLRPALTAAFATGF